MRASARCAPRDQRMPADCRALRKVLPSRAKSAGRVLRRGQPGPSSEACKREAAQQSTNPPPRLPRRASPHVHKLRNVPIAPCTPPSDRLAPLQRRSGLSRARGGERHVYAPASHVLRLLRMSYCDTSRPSGGEDTQLPPKHQRMCPRRRGPGPCSWLQRVPGQQRPRHRQAHQVCAYTAHTSAGAHGLRGPGGGAAVAQPRPGAQQRRRAMHST